MTAMNVLFVFPAAPDKSPFSTSEKRPPLGLGSLISVLRARGHRVWFRDHYLTPDSAIQEGFLERENIDFFGVYVNTICLRQALALVDQAEERRRQGKWAGKLVAGGPQTSVALHTIPAFIDFVVQGEGEEAIIDIVEGRTTGRLICRGKLKDIDSLPFQPWDIFTAMAYDFSCPWIDLKPVYTLNTSRGCPFNCSFCSVGSLWGRQYTYFSADRVVAEIDFLVRHHQAQGIYFREDNFTLNLGRTAAFCQLLIKKGLTLPWACETRVDNLTEDMLALMARAGCRAFYLGIESGSQRMLDLLNKNINLDQVAQAVAWCKKYGIKTYFSLITGIPGETYRDFRLTRKLLRDIRPSAYGFNVYVGLADSPLYRYVRQNRLFEYEDDIGLLYLPGFDVKTRFFYRQDSRTLVDHRFNWRNRSCYDWLLLCRLYVGKLKNILEWAIKKAIPRRP